MCCRWAFAWLLAGTLCPATARCQDDDRGLLPPPERDHSGRAAGIRKAVAEDNLSAALDKATELSRREPHNFEGPLWEGVLYLQQKDFYSAVRALRRAEALSANVWVLKLLAAAYYGAHQRRLFLLKINEALRLQPDDFAPYYYLGRYYDSDLGDFRRAAEYFREAIARNPGHFRSYYYLGYCHEVNQEAEKAERLYRQAIDLAEREHTGFAMPYEGLARLRLAANKPEQAVAFAKRAIELDPANAAGHKLLAKSYSGLRREAEAAAEWEESTRLDPTDASSCYRLYRAYVTLGNTEKAKAVLEQYKKIAAQYGTN